MYYTSFLKDLETAAFFPVSWQLMDAAAIGDSAVCYLCVCVYAVEEPEHPLGYREPRGTNIQCDPAQVEVISAAIIAVVRKPVHPSLNLRIILLLKVCWRKMAVRTC